jgi:hypothetical protein
MMFFIPLDDLIDIKQPFAYIAIYVYYCTAFRGPDSKQKGGFLESKENWANPGWRASFYSLTLRQYPYYRN